MRRGTEQVGNGVELQAKAIQADGGAPGRFGRAVSFKASELGAALFAAPLLLTGNDVEPDQAATAAPGTARKIRDYQRV